MRSRIFLTRCLAPCVLLAAVSSCARPERLTPIYPPSADLMALTEAKPVPGVEILTSEAAANRHDAAVESWGDRLSAAGARVCRWAVDNGAKLPFACPARPVTEMSQ